MSDDLTKLAAACERAASELRALALNSGRFGETWDTRQVAQLAWADAEKYDAHARALREGRVTVNEGGDDRAGEAETSLTAMHHAARAEVPRG